MTINKNKKGGIVGDLVNGAGGLIIGVVIILVIVSTLLGANLLRATATTTTVLNEAGHINLTGYTLAEVDGLNREFTIVQIVNATSGQILTSGNWTLTDGALANVTTVWDTVNINYTYIAPTAEETTTSALGGNFSNGIDNVSTRLPVIFLIAAVVLLFGVLVILVLQAKKSGLMGGNQGTL